MMNGFRIIDSMFYLMASRSGIWNGLVLLENTHMNSPLEDLVCGWMGGTCGKVSYALIVYFVCYTDTLISHLIIYIHTE